MSEKPVASIAVPAKDPKKKDEKDAKEGPSKPNGDAKEEQELVSLA
jgi:26S proteasome regulatory subunit N1